MKEKILSGLHSTILRTFIGFLTVMMALMAFKITEYAWGWMEIQIMKERVEIAKMHEEIALIKSPKRDAYCNKIEQPKPKKYIWW